MATKKKASFNPSIEEIRQYDFNFRPDMPAGVTIASATAKHTCPGLVNESATVGTIAEGIVPVALGPLSYVGWHRLKVTATYSDGKTSVMILQFETIV